MRIIIGTPAFGGLVNTNYLVSMVHTVQLFCRDKVDYTLFTLANESLINRGRNAIATAALKGKYEKLIFIDADMGWTYEDMVAVCNSDKGIVGGTYPLKGLPISLNFNPLPQHVDIFKDEDITKTYKKSVEKFDLYKQKYADAKGEVEVIHIPTGFMAINIKILEMLKDKVPSYEERDFYTGKMETFYEFFPVRIKNRVLESEDWAFCSIARENGIPVYLNTNVVLTHAGTYTFKK